MNVLAFFAHPDDETILAGGILALLAQDGAVVHYLCATRGEGGETGEPPLATREALGAAREAELRCAVQALDGRSLEFLDYLDPVIGPGEELFPYTQDLGRLAGELEAVLHRRAIDVVLTHGSNGEYGHPAHLVSHQAARLAVGAFSSGAVLLYSVAASFPEHPRPRLTNRDDPAHLIVDVTPAIDKKIQATLCHRTQNALFVRRASQEAGRDLTVAEVIMPVESLHRHFPAWGDVPGSDPGSGPSGDPDDELAHWLGKYRLAQGG